MGFRAVVEGEMSRRTLGATITALALLLVGASAPVVSASDGDEAADLTAAGTLEGYHQGPFCSTDILGTGTFDLDRSVEEEDGEPATVAWTITYTIESACGLTASRCEGTHPYPEGLSEVDAECPLGVLRLSSFTLEDQVPCTELPQPAPASCHRASFHVWIEHLGRLFFHAGDVDGVAVAQGAAGPS